MKNFCDWVLDMISESIETRWEYVNQILNATAESSSSKELHEFLGSVVDKKTWELIGFSANLEFVPLEGEKGLLQNVKWLHPFLLMKHKKLPAMVIFGPDIDDSETQFFEYQKTYDGPRERLSWTKTLSLLENPKRRLWVRKILEGIVSYRPKTTTKEVVFLSDALQDTKTWEIIGFSNNLQYVRVEHDNDDLLKYIFVHPWGTPPLLVQHKRLPVFMIVGPGIRWNDSILREIKDNKIIDTEIEGATG